MKYFTFLLFCCLPFTSFALIDQSLAFDSTQQSQQYEQLIGQLRCLVCQNQSLAESNATLAKDLRKEVYEQVKLGKSSEAINQYLVARYGDYVLYKPRVVSMNYLLWFAPVAFMLFGLGFIVKRFRRVAC